MFITLRWVSFKAPKMQVSTTSLLGSGLSGGTPGGPSFNIFNVGAGTLNYALTTDQTKAFVRAYFGAVRPEHERSLTLMRFMSDFREAMWGVVQQGLSELDFDFVAYADEHFERLERTAAEPSFRAALI